MTNQIIAPGMAFAQSRITSGECSGQPVILLTYSQAGAEYLQRILATHPSLACTSGTGVLPLCQAAAVTWQKIEARNPGLSSLAITSIRAIVSSMIAIITAGAGASRWCETAIAGPDAAEIFLQIFPLTKFICFYRSCSEVISEGIELNPWGLGGTAFWSYSQNYPGNSVAMIAAYWADCTAALLEFEYSHGPSCLRLTSEDLAAATIEQLDLVSSFLNLRADRAGAGQPGGLASEILPASAPTPPASSQIPVGKVPPRLRTRINELHKILGYPPLVM